MYSIVSKSLSLDTWTLRTTLCSCDIYHSLPHTDKFLLMWVSWFSAGRITSLNEVCCIIKSFNRLVFFLLPSTPHMPLSLMSHYHASKHSFTTSSVFLPITYIWVPSEINFTSLSIHLGNFKLWKQANLRQYQTPLSPFSLRKLSGGYKKILCIWSKEKYKHKANYKLFYL